MSLKLMYITNEKSVAKIAEESGVDWIFIDLEINGKVARQGHLDTVISRHHISDIKEIKSVLTTTQILVRVNPIYDSSKDEIDKVIEAGADIVMLPFFKTKEEVEKVIEYVNSRAKVCLLCETPEAVSEIDNILNLSGIDFIHIGLNDLHLGYKMKFMFEPLANGLVEELCSKFDQKNISYGFGGIAKIGQGMLPAENILAEHYRLGSSMVILSRSFCNTSEIKDMNTIRAIFQEEIHRIRKYENELVNANRSFFAANQAKVNEIVEKKITNKVL
ncbi:aldolase/citrate lyase family protein [Priestia filamentosa]|uniref:aldolase/citrate lyase family protein n=1 Tax=Priestia filamentosa TaxID=1402861 RepID=UPI00234AD30B|nr:aldolase/citrate lyase family protein [Priestia filamentosa]WCM14581.1 aldolase/citrate lyase family protein [Priestia filamentosa]